MKKITKRKIIAPVLSVAAVAVNLIISFLAALPLIALSTLKPLEAVFDKDIIRLLMRLFGAAAAILFSCLAVKAVTKVRIKEALNFKDFDFSVPIMLALFTFSAGRIVRHFSGLILPDAWAAEQSGDSVLFLILTSLLIAPVSEEIMFRFSACELGRGAYTIWDICIMNSLFFALCRGGSVPGFADAFIFGLCAAYVYCKTRNILYTMLGNVLYSGLCLIPFIGNGSSLYNWQYLLICGIIIAGCAVWYIKVFRKRYTENYFTVGIPEGDENLPDRVKQTKSFSKVCRNIHIFAAAAEIIYGLAVLLVLLGALNVPFVEITGFTSKWELLPEIIWDAALLIVFNFMRLIFGKLKKTDTPFSEGIDRKFKAIAYTLVIGGGVYFFTSLIVSGYISVSVPIEEMNISYTDGLYMLMIGTVIWGLAYVFERGCVLQRESDETL